MCNNRKAPTGARRCKIPKTWFGKQIATTEFATLGPNLIGISGLVVEYIVAIDVTRVRFPADASISGAGPLAPAPSHAKPTLGIEPRTFSLQD